MTPVGRESALQSFAVQALGALIAARAWNRLRIQEDTASEPEGDSILDTRTAGGPVDIQRLARDAWTVALAMVEAAPAGFYTK